jgi:hypothetical protein
MAAPAAFSVKDRWMFVARAIVSVIILLPSIRVILNSASFSDATMKWAIGSSALILGYWLR